MKLGYCCINMSNPKLKVNRGMVKKTFTDKGLVYAGELAEKNLLDLYEIIKWNVKNNIFLYRMSSDMFPWMSEYELVELPNFKKIKSILSNIGCFANSNGVRLTFHPGPYNVLGSETESVVIKTIKELNQHAEIMDYMGLSKTTYNCINIHLNTTKPNKVDASYRFINNFNRLNESVKSRLVVEIDDKENQYTTIDLYEMVYEKINIPITFDYLHFECNKGGFDLKMSLQLCLSTWKNIKPLTHFSSSRQIEEPTALYRAHADYLHSDIETFGYDFDIEFECKMKDLALFDWNKKYKII